MKTPFDNWFVLFHEQPSVFVKDKRIVYMVELRHKNIPDLKFSVSGDYIITDSINYMQLFNKVYAEVYKASKFSKAQNIDGIVTGTWDEDKQEWYIIDENNNKKYESEFPPLYRSSNQEYS